MFLWENGQFRLECLPAFWLAGDPSQEVGLWRGGVRGRLTAVITLPNISSSQTLVREPDLPCTSQSYRKRPVSQSVWVDVLGWHKAQGEVGEVGKR